MRNISQFIDETVIQREKKSKSKTRSAFFFAKTNKLQESFNQTISKNKQEKKERIMKEQTELYLEAIIKEVNLETQDPYCAFVTSDLVMCHTSD